ncbi:MAG: hypothetical protein IKC69_00140 [Clostridia bacterium]|nr:hypothetical protein [Clostridia bacterium]
MENKEKETFHYTYSARDREEIKAIREKYAAPEGAEDKMAQLRRLDATATKRATSVSLVLGVLGALIMGMGMSLVMTEIGGIIGLSDKTALLIGIPLGLVGILLAGVAYPVYNRILKRERARIAPEILRLADDLMK